MRATIRKANPITDCFTERHSDFYARCGMMFKLVLPKLGHIVQMAVPG
jgi:hypothetical protein